MRQVNAIYEVAKSRLVADETDDLSHVFLCDDSGVLALEAVREVARHDEPELKAEDNCEEHAPVLGGRSGTSIRSAMMSGHHRWPIVSHRSDVCVGYFVTQANPINSARNTTPTMRKTDSHSHTSTTSPELP